MSRRRRILHLRARMRRYLGLTLRYTWRVTWRTTGLLLLLLLSWLTAMVATEWGTEQLRQSLNMFPRVHVAKISGTVVSGMTLSDATLTLKKSTWHFQRIDMEPHWSCLWRFQLCLSRLDIDDVHIDMPMPKTPKPVLLRQIFLPFQLTVMQGRARNIVLQRDSRSWSLDELQLRGSLAGSFLRLEQLRLTKAAHELVLHGQMTLLDHYALQAQGQYFHRNWQSHEAGPLSLALNGDLATLQLDAYGSKSLPVQLALQMQSLQPGTPYQGTLTWPALDWPFHAQGLLHSNGGRVQIAGDSRAYRLQADSHLSGRFVPDGRWRMRATGNWSGMDATQIFYSGLSGSGAGKGHLDWQHGVISWQLSSSFAGIVPRQQWPLWGEAIGPLQGILNSKGSLSPARSFFETGFEGNAGHLSSQAHFPGLPWRPDMPVQVELQWRDLDRRWWGTGVRSANGKVQLTGTWKRLQMSGDASAVALDIAALADRGMHFPQGDWQFSGLVANHQLALSTLSYNGELGTYQGSATIDWQHGWQWQLAGVLPAVRPEDVVPELPGELSASVSLHGHGLGRNALFRLQLKDLRGHLREQAVSGALDIERLDANAGWQAHELALVQGENRLSAQGVWGTAAQDFQLDAQLPRLSGLWPGLSGDALLSLTAAGNVASPDLRLAFSAHALQAPWLSAQLLKLNADVQQGLQIDSQLQWHAENLQRQSLQLAQIDGRFEGNAASSALTTSGNWQGLEWAQVATGALTGDWQKGFSQWQGHLDESRLHFLGRQWLQREPVLLTARREQPWLTLQQNLCWQGADVGVGETGSDTLPLGCLDRAVLGYSGELALRLKHLPLSDVSRLLPAGLSLAGTMDGAMAMTWSEGKAGHLDGQLQAREGQIQLLADEGDAVRMPFSRLSLEAALGLRQDVLTKTTDSIADKDPEANAPAANAVTTDTTGQGRVRLTLESADAGHGFAEIMIDPSRALNAQPLNGQILLSDLALPVLRPFFPGLSRLEGRADFVSQLRGHWQDPQWFGSLRVHDAEVMARALPFHFYDVQLDVPITDHAAEISGSFRSGEGQATISNGSVQWQDAKQWQAGFDVAGNDLLLDWPPRFHFRYDPNLSFAIHPGQVDVRGKLLAHDSQLRLDAASEHLVPVSEDIVLASLRESEALARAKRWQVNSDIDVTLGDEVYFSGFDVNGELTGQLRLQQSGFAAPRAAGDLELLDARYKAYGQKLDIRKGRLVFNGALAEPALDVEAVKQVGTVTAGVKVSGRASSPQAVLFSDTASLSQDDIMSYLLFNRPVSTAQQGANSDLGTRAAMSLGILGGQELADSLGESLNIRDLELETEGEGDNTRVTVGGHLSSNLYIGYGVGVFTPVNKLTLRYNISNKLYLEAVTALENAVDIFYSFSFGKRKE